MPITRSGMISNNIGTTNTNNNNQQSGNIFSNNNNTNNTNNSNNIFTNNNSNKTSNNIFANSNNNNNSKNIFNNNNTNSSNNIFNNNNASNNNNSNSRNIFNNNNTSGNNSSNIFSNNNNNNSTKNNIFNNNNSNNTTNNIFTNNNNKSSQTSSNTPTFYDPVKQKQWVNSLRFNTKQIQQHFDYLKLKCLLFEINKEQNSENIHFIIDKLKKAFEIRIKDIDELNKQLVENINKKQLVLSVNNPTGRISNIFTNNYSRNTTSRSIFNNSTNTNNIFNSNNKNTNNIFTNNRTTTTTTHNNIFSSNNNKDDYQMWLPIKKQQYYTCYQEPIIISQEQFQLNMQRLKRIREKNMHLIITIVKLKTVLEQRLRNQQQPYPTIYSNNLINTTKTPNHHNQHALNTLCDSILYISRAISNKIQMIKACEEGKRHQKQLQIQQQIKRKNKTQQQLLEEKVSKFNPQEFMFIYIKQNQQQLQQQKQNSIDKLNPPKRELLNEYQRQQYQVNKVKQSHQRIQVKRQQRQQHINITPQKKETKITSNLNNKNNNIKKDELQNQQQKSLQINYILTLLTQTIPKLQQQTKFYHYEIKQLQTIRDQAIKMKRRDNQ